MTTEPETISETISETNPEPEIAWDLSDLYAGPDDPRIDATLAQSAARARAFAETYAGRIDSPELSAQTLLKAIQDYEALWQEAGKPGMYARLAYAADTGDAARGALMARVGEETTRLGLPLVFFRLELARASDAVILSLLEDPALAVYRHYVEQVRAGRPHQLSDVEETLLARFSDTGPRAFVRLGTEVRARTVFRPRLPDGTAPELNQPQLTALYSSPDRAVRRAASEAFVEGATPHLKTLTFILNTLMQDKAVSDEIRHYDAPEETGFQRDELPRATVELVTDITVEHYPLAHRYYALKARAMGLDALRDYDLYAPLAEADETFGFEEARAIVLDAFGAFSPALRDLAGEFFERRWIDATPRPGKQGGAFCSYSTPDTHPYIFTNYLGRLPHVMTLAHELGHGVHGMLSRGQRYFNMFGTLPMAEVASLFGEMLVFDKLRTGAAPDRQKSMLADKLDSAVGTMSTTARYRLEKTIHRQRRAEGELTPEQISAHWRGEMAALYGPDLGMTERLPLAWSYIPHFYGSPFYSYPYTFGELFALSLYRKSQDEGAAFAAQYLELLSAGGRDTPHSLAKIVGADLDDPAFWRGGFAVISGLIDSFEAL